MLPQRQFPLRHLVAFEERHHVGGDVGRGQSLDAVQHAHDGVVGIRFQHGLPVVAHEVPSLFAATPVAQALGHQVRRVLGAHGAVEAHAKRGGHLVGGGKRCQQVLVTPHFLRRGAGLETLDEHAVVVFAAATGYRPGRRRGDVWLHAAAILQVAGMQIAALLLRSGVIGCHRQGADNQPPQLQGARGVVRLRRPSQPFQRWGVQVAQHRLVTRFGLPVQQAAQVLQTAAQQRPHVEVVFVSQSLRQGEEIGRRRVVREHRRPGIVHQRVAFDGSELLQDDGPQLLQQRRRISNAVETVPAGIDHHPMDGAAQIDLQRG